jgi:hypothetical protein
MYAYMWLCASVCLLCVSMSLCVSISVYLCVCVSLCLYVCVSVCLRASVSLFWPSHIQIWLGDRLLWPRIIMVFFSPPKKTPIYYLPQIMHRPLSSTSFPNDPRNHNLFFNERFVYSCTRNLKWEALVSLMYISRHKSTYKMKLEIITMCISFLFYIFFSGWMNWRLS